MLRPVGVGVLHILLQGRVGGPVVSSGLGRVEEPGTLQCSTVLRKEAAYQAESHKHS